MTLAQDNYSGSQERRVETVELTDGTTTLRYVLGHSDVTCEGVTYTSLPMDADSLADPAQDGDGAQEITLVLDNIDTSLGRFCYRLNRDKTNGEVTRRTYSEADLDTPLAAYSMTIKNIESQTPTEVAIVCGYMQILDLAFPRGSMNLVKYPGIRYL